MWKLAFPSRESYLKKHDQVSPQILYPVNQSYKTFKSLKCY